MLQANCIVDIVRAPDQAAAVSADIRWRVGVPCAPHLIDSTWERVQAHAAEAGDSKGAWPCNRLTEANESSASAGDRMAERVHSLGFEGSLLRHEMHSYSHVIFWSMMDCYV